MFFPPLKYQLVATLHAVSRNFMLVHKLTPAAFGLNFKKRNFLNYFPWRFKLVFFVLICII